ncbi:FBP domain-containing protein [Curtobacterium sp. MCBD17_013]|uniref:FBP domain-containing protein n=1 Tax=Curtobacterium sp. MCBD17_013 TaxID=2175668 RepID=UPI000DA7038A|nr:FBP domain-containing protein [Curtobacterium sp. MCBD17_013]PZF59429.1 FBP domain-containing protein [Curtobacterium sp. MCBD17_013]
MLPITEKAIRAAFVNASRKEVSDITLPSGFDALDWDALDYLGWRDPKIGRRAYAIVPDGDALVGILFRQADGGTRTRPQCAWCQDVRLPNDVLFYSARRSGASGRNGNTVGTLVCADFQCSANVRNPPPPAYLGFDVEAARHERIVSLRQRAAAFARDVRGA